MANDRHYEFVEKYFAWQHLRENLRPVSRPFRECADAMLAQTCSDEAELMAGLRKLLEAKDCAVRAAL